MSSVASGYPYSKEYRFLPLWIGLGTLVLAAHSSAAIATFPAVSQQIGISVVAGQWIVTVYTLVLSASLLTFGAIADRVGLKRVCVCGLLVFAAASGLCALAEGLGALVLLRAVQAVGAAMVSATSIALIGRDIPESRRGQALGWETSMTYAGLGVGPVVGAYIVERVGWRALFLVNIPAAAIAALALWRFAHASDETSVNVHTMPDGRPGRMLIQTVAWTATLLATLLAIGQSKYQKLCFAAALVCAAGFVAVNGRGSRQLLPWAAFRQNGFRSAVMNEVLFYGCVHAAGFLLPLYLIRQRGLSVVAASAYLGAQAGARALAAVLSGRITDRVGSRVAVIVAAMVLCGSLYWTTAFVLNTPWWEVSTVMMLLGASTGVFVPANSRAMLDAAVLRRYGVSSAILATARNLGMTLGVALAAVAYAGRGASLTRTSNMTAMHESFAICAGAALLFTVGRLAQFRPLRLHQACARRFCGF